METSTNIVDSSTEFIVPDDRLYLATRAWIMFLQGLFSTRRPGQFKWHSNPTESEIIISDALPTDTSRTNKRPMIVTMRGPAQYMGTSRDQTLKRNMAGDNITFSDNIGTVINFNCVAKEGIEAQEIAYTIFRMIPVFKPSIMRLGRMHAIGNNISISTESGHNAIVPGSSFPEWRSVTVSAPFYIQDVIKADKDFHNIIHAVNLHMGLT